VVVMLAVAATVILAAFWRPVRHGGVLLAGAAVPMAAQAISALVQAGQPASPAQFGISNAQASALGLTIDSGVTPAFWIYCTFGVVLLVSCAWMLFTPQPAAAPGPLPAPGDGPAAARHENLSAEPREDGDGGQGTTGEQDGAQQDSADPDSADPDSADPDSAHRDEAHQAASAQGLK
jgi:hypothetical protein